MSAYSGIYTYDADAHKYVPISQVLEILDLEKEKKMDKNEKRKNEILTKLRCLGCVPTLLEHERAWIRQTIDYIKEAK